MRILLILAMALLCACRPAIKHPGGPIAEPPFIPAAAAPVEHIDAPPPPRPPAIVEDAPVSVRPKRRDFATIAESVTRGLEDAYFPYDRAELTPEALAALRHDAAVLAPLLAEFPDAQVVVEGHCDERGSAEYNLALGDRRAQRTREVLATLGLPESRLAPISYGNEQPQCETHAESCWRLNRRAHLAIRTAP